MQCVRLCLLTCAGSVTKNGAPLSVLICSRSDAPLPPVEPSLPPPLGDADGSLLIGWLCVCVSVRIEGCGCAPGRATEDEGREAAAYWMSSQRRIALAPGIPFNLPTSSRNSPNSRTACRRGDHVTGSQFSQACGRKSGRLARLIAQKISSRLVSADPNHHRHEPLDRISS